MKQIFKLIGHLSPFRWRIVAAIVLGTGTIVASVGLLSSSGYLLSRAALQPPILDLIIIITSVRFFGISRAVLRYADRLISHDITFRILMNIRSMCFRQICALPAIRFNTRHSGNLLSNITSDVEELQNFYIKVFTPITIAFLTSALTFIFLFQFHPKTAFITLILLLINGFLTPFFIRYLARGIGNEEVALRSKLKYLWIEQTQGSDEIRLFGLRKKYLVNVRNLGKKIKRIERKESFIDGLQEAVFLWTMYVTIVLALFVLTPSILDGDLQGVLLAMILFCIMASFEATQPLSNALQSLEATEKSAKNLDSLFETDICEISRVDPQEDSHIVTLQKLESHQKKTVSQTPLLYPETKNIPEILFENITFAYQKRNVLENLSFAINKKESVALIGPTGCGKSTTIDLLLRHYDPDTGNIYLSGKNLKNIDVDGARAAFSCVEQFTYIFNDTLRNNLLLASLKADDNALLSALKRVELEAWYLSLPNGLDTVLGEHGKSMSGGERQRIAIARALLKDTQIWLFDEPTANLDTITERQIIRILRKATENKTVLWVTHRLTEMHNFDQILVMRDGQIIQKGDHSELLKKGGWYADMVKIQNDQID